MQDHGIESNYGRIGSTLSMLPSLTFTGFGFTSTTPSDQFSWMDTTDMDLLQTGDDNEGSPTSESHDL